MNSTRNTRNLFRNRVVLILIFFVAISICYWVGRFKSTPVAQSVDPVYEAIRLKTHTFIHHYQKQLSVDFGNLKDRGSGQSTKEQPNVGDTKVDATIQRPAYPPPPVDGNTVVDVDAGPQPPVEEKKSFTTFSSVILKPPSADPSPVSIYVSDRDGHATANIVIGMAQNTDPKNLVTFCASLRKHSQADIVLFMNMPVSDRNNEIVKKYNVRVIPFLTSAFDSKYRSYHPSTLRWILMSDFFKAAENSDKYKFVWMIDVRDSVFQADPFAMIENEKSAFYTFKGVEDKTISQCGWNGGWVKDCFGQQKLNEVGSKSIICSGVSVGTIDTVLHYLEKMRSIVEGGVSDADFPKCERNGVDQGIHNVLVHTNQIKNFRIFNQATSPVLNLQARIANVDEKNGIVRNKEGRIAAVVHQYDRFPVLQQTLFQQYAYWIDFSDAMFEWNADSVCQRFKYVKDVDMFKGICDFKISGGMTGPNSCCSVCASYADCSSFTFYQGQCFLKKGCQGKTKGNGLHLAGAVSAYYI